MSSILDLELAVMDENRNAVRGILDELDRRTENELFEQAAAQFGFRLVTHRGRRLAMRAEVARVMGYTEESGLRKLCDRYDLEAVPAGTFGHDVRMSLVEEGVLSRRDGKTVFIGWDTFLVAGMHGTTRQALQVKRYLLESERKARVGGALFDIKHSEKHRLAEADKVVSLLGRIDRMKNHGIRRAALQHMEEALGRTLDLGQQRELLLEPPKGD